MLAFGGVIFWIIIGIIFFVITFCVETDDEVEIGWPVGWLVFGGVALYFSWKTEFTSILHNIDWLLFGMCALAYILIGILWLFFKWRNYSKKQFKLYTLKIEKYKNLTILKESYIPIVSDNIMRINNWILFWPFSIIRYCVNNMISDFMKYIRTSLTVFLNKMAERQFK